jgi:hypothetical protein
MEKAAAHRGRALAAAVIGFMPLGSYLRVGVKEKIKWFASLGGGRDCNFAWKLTEARFFGLPSFARNVGFHGLLHVQKLATEAIRLFGLPVLTVRKLGGNPNNQALSLLQGHNISLQPGKSTSILLQPKHKKNRGASVKGLKQPRPTKANQL